MFKNKNYFLKFDPKFAKVKLILYKVQKQILNADIYILIFIIKFIFKITWQRWFWAPTTLALSDVRSRELHLYYLLLLSSQILYSIHEFSPTRHNNFNKCILLSSICQCSTFLYIITSDVLRGNQSQRRKRKKSVLDN